MKKSKLFSLILILSIILWIIAFSISVPIFWRGFYYLHMDLLKLSNSTGYSVEVMKAAYNEMLDYCIGISDIFGCGELRYSVEGMSHFTDCRGLFKLDFIFLAITTVINGVSLILIKLKKCQPYHFNHHRCSYCSALITLVSFAVIAFFASLDFDKAFVVFHTLFFPGKDNWLFDSRKDQIINILPEIFFADCAILIVLILSGICVFFIAYDKKKPVL